MYGTALIDAETRLCCLIGNPVRHSLSPRMHNAAFAARNMDAVYLPMEGTGMDDLCGPVPREKLAPAHDPRRANGGGDQR